MRPVSRCAFFSPEVITRICGACGVAHAFPIERRLGLPEQLQTGFDTFLVAIGWELRDDGSRRCPDCVAAASSDCAGEASSAAS